MLEQLLSKPGFLYEVDGKYYFLGKWICKECTETDASDCVMMYQMCRSEGEEKNTNLYFQKLRAYSDFALEVPYNPVLIRSNMEALLTSCSETALQKLEQQFTDFNEDLERFA